MKEKYFSRFENLLNIWIINDEIEQFFEKNSIDYLILDILNKNKFFELKKSSPYSIQTIEKLNNISDKIYKNNLSLKQMEKLLNDKEQI